MRFAYDHIRKFGILFPFQGKKQLWYWSIFPFIFIWNLMLYRTILSVKKIIEIIQYQRHFWYWNGNKIPNFHIWPFGNLIIYANLFVMDSSSFKHPRWNVKIAQLDGYWRLNHKILIAVGITHINNLTFQMMAFWLPWQPESCFVFLTALYGIILFCFLTAAFYMP